MLVWETKICGQTRRVSCQSGEKLWHECCNAVARELDMRIHTPFKCHNFRQLSVEDEKKEIVFWQRLKDVFLVRCPTRPMSVRSSVGLMLTFLLLLSVTLNKHSALPSTLPRLVGVQTAWKEKNSIMQSSAHHIINFVRLNWAVMITCCEYFFSAITHQSSKNRNSITAVIN